MSKAYTSEASCNTCGNSQEMDVHNQGCGVYEPAPGNDNCPECGEAWGEPFQPWNQQADPAKLAEWIGEHMQRCPRCDKDPVTAEEHAAGVTHPHTVVTFTGDYPGAWRCECGCLINTRGQLLGVAAEVAA